MKTTTIDPLHPVGTLALVVALVACGGGSDADGAEGDETESSGGSGDGSDDGDTSDLPVPAQCQNVAATVGPWFLRRLTGAQLDNTVRDLLGTSIRPSDALPPDEVVGAFYSNTTAPITDAMVESYMDLAESMAAEAVGDLDALLPCDPSANGDNACAAQFVDDFGQRAYRRPLTDSERQALMGAYEVGVGFDGFSGGIRLVITAALQSPYFLYHAEFGPQTGDAYVPLDDYALASRLSYFLWNTMPDDELMTAADQGRLFDDPAALRQQAERLLQDERAATGIRSFHLQWLGIADLDSLEKDPGVFPNYTPSLGAAMQRETGTFADYIIRFNDGKLSTLLTAPFSFPEGDVFDIYGVAAPAGYDATTPVALDPTQRAGLLTQPSVMTMHAQADQTSPIRRGVLVRENVLCQMLPEPPPDVDNVPPQPDESSTTRERFEQHRADPACAACHELIDPLGFGFEYYDGVGAFRSTENGMPVDGSGELTAAGDIGGPFDGATELAQMLAESDEVRQCVSTQWFRYAFGRIETDQDDCTLATLDAAFAASDYNVRELLLSLVMTDAFRLRPAPTSASTTKEPNR